MRRCSSLAFPLTIAGLLVGPSTGLAQEPGPVFHVIASSIGPDGSVRGSATAHHEFKTDQPHTSFKFAGNLEQGDYAGCSVGGSESGYLPLESLVERYAYVWQVTTTARKQEQGRLVFDLEWARYTSGGGTRPVASRRQRLSLAEGDRFIIDMLHAPQDAVCRNGTLVIDLQAGAREHPSLVDTTLQYELWLVHTDPSGKKRSSRASLTGLHGREQPFAFSALRFAVPTLAPDQYVFDLTTRISGALRGRAREDGRISVDLETSRRDRLERRDLVDEGRPFGGEGRKQLTVAPGEAVEIPLPAGGGMAASYASAAAAEAGKGKSMALRGGPGVGSALPSEAFSIRDGRLTVNFKRFFEGHQVSLILRVTRVE